MVMVSKYIHCIEPQWISLPLPQPVACHLVAIAYNLRRSQLSSQGAPTISRRAIR